MKKSIGSPAIAVSFASREREKRAADETKARRLCLASSISIRMAQRSSAVDSSVVLALIQKTAPVCMLETANIAAPAAAGRQPPSRRTNIWKTNTEHMKCSSMLKSYCSLTLPGARCSNA